MTSKYIPQTWKFLWLLFLSFFLTRPEPSSVLLMVHFHPLHTCVALRHWGSPGSCLWCSLWLDTSGIYTWSSKDCHCHGRSWFVGQRDKRTCLWSQAYSPSVCRQLLWSSIHLGGQQDSFHVELQQQAEADPLFNVDSSMLKQQLRFQKNVIKFVKSLKTISHGYDGVKPLAMVTMESNH